MSEQQNVIFNSQEGGGLKEGDVYKMKWDGNLSHELHASDGSLKTQLSIFKGKDLCSSQALERVGALMALASGLNVSAIFEDSILFQDVTFRFFHRVGGAWVDYPVGNTLRGLRLGLLKLQSGDQLEFHAPDISFYWCREGRALRLPYRALFSRSLTMGRLTCTDEFIHDLAILLGFCSNLSVVENVYGTVRSQIMNYRFY